MFAWFLSVNFTRLKTTNTGVLGFLYVPDYGGDELGCSQRLDFWFLGILASQPRTNGKQPGFSR